LSLRSIRIVNAWVEAKGQLLMVQQQGPQDPAPAWALPGGRVEPGEHLLQTLARELREETGLTLIPASAELLYATEVWDEGDAMHLVAFTFRCAVSTDTPIPDDPDGLILEARFVPLNQAAQLLHDHPYPPMAEPTQRWLSGERASFWSYHLSALGIATRVHPA
jgi:8-oxo-dGTP diphosphatase